MAAAPRSPEVIQGERIARANCGECHEVGSGKSPLADAPPFAELYKRYRAGGLEGLLTEGMLARDPPLEEGSSNRHPRMPSVMLDLDQRKSLIAYLHSLEPTKVKP